MDAERARIEQANRNARWIAEGDPLKSELAEIGKEAFRAKYWGARYNQAFSGHVAQIRMILDELDREEAADRERRVFAWTVAGVVFAALAAAFALVTVLQGFD